MRLATLALGIVAFAAPTVQADSIWDRRSPQYAFPLRDFRPRHVGDIVTVAIRQSTIIIDEDELALSRTSRMGGDFSIAGNLSGTGGSPFRNWEAAMGGNHDSSKSTGGESRYNVDRRIIDRLTVSVKAVLPNGLLYIEGYRQRVISGERRLVRISGVIRQQDVDASNVVDSQAVSNFRMAYSGKGLRKRYSRPGLLHRIGSKLWPF